MNPPPAPPFANFLEHVRTTENKSQFSSEWEDILEQELQRQRNLPTPTPSRDYYWAQYVQALAANEHLKHLFLDVPRFTDIIVLKHLHSHATLRSLQLNFNNRRGAGNNYYRHHDMEIEHTLAQFDCLEYLYIQANVNLTHRASPRFMQALLKGISQNPSLRRLSMFHMHDFSLHEQLDWTKSKLQKLHMEECDLSISTWKGLLTMIPSLDILQLSGRIPRHVLSRSNDIFGSAQAKSRSIRNLVIKWQESPDITYLETMIRFFDFENLTLDFTEWEWGDDEQVPPPEEFQENFSRICGLVDPAISKLSCRFESCTIHTIHSGCFPELLRTILGFPAVVGMKITSQDDVDESWNPSQCLRVLTEHGEHLERLDMSGILDATDDDVCNIIASFPRLRYLTAYVYPTSTIAEAVDAHPHLLQLEFELLYGEEGKKFADRARDRIETSLRRNRANRFARRISSQTTCSETGAGLKLWPTILASVDKGNAMALSGVFQAFRNDIERLLVGQEMQEQPPSAKVAVGRKRSLEEA